MTLILRVLCVVLCSIVCARAQAQTASEHFQRGVAALQGGDHATAVSAFEAAYALEHDPVALFNLGIAYTNLGRVHNALDALEAYARYADPARDAQNIGAVRAEIERLRGTSAVLTLQLQPPDASVAVDGVTLLVRGGEIVVAPGNRRFVVSAPGYEPYDQVLVINAGAFTLPIALRAAPPQPVAPALPEAGAAAAATEPLAGCAAGSVCLGPVLALGVPNLVGGGFHFRFGEYAGAGIDFQVLPSLGIDTVSIGASLLTIAGRVYPFGGAFFLGAGFGYQNLSGSVTDTGVSAEASVGVPTFYAGIGFMGHDGFVLGFDLGFLFTVGSQDISIKDSASGGPSAPAQSEINRIRQDAEKGVRDVLDFMPFLPQVNVLRLGYLF